MPGKAVRLKTCWLVGLTLMLSLAACNISPAGEELTPMAGTGGETLTPANSSPSPTFTEEISGVNPTISPTAEDFDCSETTGSIDAYQITRKGLELSGRIYTPPCYGLNPQQKYPSLYLLHGATENDQMWGDLGLAETADLLITEKSIAPLIIIMPLEITWVALPENPFGDSLITELLPWVEGEFQILADREYRAIGGLSRGGNWSLRIGLLHWGLFGSIGAHSTPLFYGDLEKVPNWIESIPDSRMPRIYLDIGEGDNNLETAQYFEDLLLDLDVPHQWNVYPGLHEDIYWISHLKEYLLWYSTGWDHLLK